MTVFHLWDWRVAGSKERHPTYTGALAEAAASDEESSVLEEHWQDGRGGTTVRTRVEVNRDGRAPRLLNAEGA